MKLSRSEQRYNELFPNETVKAQAFDKIAAAYFCGNFGQMQKADLETLMFSLYLDRILDENEEDMRGYSDYTLSKLLGITQSKISNLKVRKELLFPYDGFDWRKSLNRVIEFARYENGKIMIPIPDKNLFLEVKNVIEESGGYIEAQLNSSLMKIRPEYFVDLMIEAGDTEQRDKMKAYLVESLQKQGMKNDEILEALEQKPVSEIIKDRGISFIADVIEDCVPVVGKAVGNLLRESLIKPAIGRNIE